MSKTLDSASAQFAASALVTSEQLMGFKMKEDVVLGIGVNGVLPASGRERDMSAVEIVFVTYVSNKPKAKLRVFSCVFPFP